MVKKYGKSIFIFRREYRLRDNVGLIEALKNSESVVTIFIFTPEQVVHNKYKSNNAVQFMVESLGDLEGQLKKKGGKLCYFFGKQDEVIGKLIDEYDIDAVFVNRDYTPYSKRRDEDIEKKCKKSDVDFCSFEDYLLYPVGHVRNGSGNVYTKFTPYWNYAKTVKVEKVMENKYVNYSNMRLKGEFKGKKHKFYEVNDDVAVHGGRKLGLKILSNMGKFKNYNVERNTLIIPTTRLSAYIKFGCVSIREVYWAVREAVGRNNDLVKQLYWREFYYNVVNYFPRMLEDNLKERNLYLKFSKVKWTLLKNANEKQKEWWKKYVNGMTGVPIVDAGMRELRAGVPHNRIRLVVSSFLVKNMMFHWIEGEKIFSRHLCDVDFVVNTSNWQFIAGCGPSAQAFYRVLDPREQQKKHDPECEYIKKWIPELREVPVKDIINWETEFRNYDIKYPGPMFNVKERAKKAVEDYKKYLY